MKLFFRFIRSLFDLQVLAVRRLDPYAVGVQYQFDDFNLLVLGVFGRLSQLDQVLIRVRLLREQLSIIPDQVELVSSDGHQLLLRFDPSVAQEDLIQDVWLHLAV